MSSRAGPAPLLALLLATILGPPAAAESPPEPIVRRAILAGTWYPAEPDVLRKMATRMLDGAEVSPPDGVVRAIVAPHAGYAWSGDVAAAAYATVRGKPYRRVVLLAPSHHVAFSGVSIPKVTHYETPLGRVPVDLAARDALLAKTGFTTVPEAHAREHSLEIHLPLLQVALGEFTLVPLVVGQPPREGDAEIAGVLRPLLDDSTLLVASSDFTHYGERFGYVPFRENVKEEIHRLDGSILDAIVARDLATYWKRLDATRATVCGRRPIGILLRALPEGARGRLLRYATSGEKTGDLSTSVSYAAVVFSEKSGLDAKERATLLRLARTTLERRFADGKRPDLPGMTPRLQEKRGVFVTLHRDGRLRGCIGFLVGRKPLAEAVIDNALNAAFRDPRFPALQEDELDGLHIEISVMSPLRKITDPLREVVVGRHGIVLEKQGHRGVFLPQVPVEQGWNLAAYLRNISHKAGFRDPDAWRDGATLWTFEAQVFGEEGER